MSNKTKHTPGPWAMTEDGSDIYIESNDRIEAVCNIGGGVSCSEDEANARLIAAAPEMLEALLLITDHFPESVIQDQMGEFAETVFNAINKAKEL